MNGHSDPNSSLPFASTLCGACYSVCPVKIDIPSILVHLRARAVDHERERTIPNPELLSMKVVGWTMRTARRFALAERFMRLGRVLGLRRGRITALPWPGSAWTTSRDLPVPPKETFREWWLRERGADGPTDSGPRP
jgi:L-lactate dehydrogenase complex protein LldF